MFACILTSRLPALQRDFTFWRAKLSPVFYPTKSLWTYLFQDKTFFKVFSKALTLAQDKNRCARELRQLSSSFSKRNGFWWIYLGHCLCFLLALLEHRASQCWGIDTTPLLVPIHLCLSDYSIAFGWDPPSPPILLIVDIRAPDFSSQHARVANGILPAQCIGNTVLLYFSLFSLCDLPLSHTPKTTHRADHTFSRCLLTKK